MVNKWVITIFMLTQAVINILIVIRWIYQQKINNILLKTTLLKLSKTKQCSTPK